MHDLMIHQGAVVDGGGSPPRGALAGQNAGGNDGLTSVLPERLRRGQGT